MRVCIEPRLLPGVRCSVLKTVKSCPWCWMTMPGRSCVALTLLIFSLDQLRISEIQAGQEHGRIRNDSRHAGQNPRPARIISIECLVRGGQSASLPGKEFPSRKCSLRSETLALYGDRHPGIVNVNQAPSALLFAVELRFPAVCRTRRAIFSELGGEIPIKSGPVRVPVYMNGNVMNTQFAFGEGVAHQMHVDILLYLLETVLMAQWVDKGNVRRIQPDLRSEIGVRAINGFRIFLNQASDHADVIC